jgi:uncharacterized protein
LPSNFYVVSQTNREYIIPFIGLKTGFHSFEYDVTDKFFEEIEYSIIHQGNVNVKLELEKKETMFIGVFNVEGRVTVDCDRCNEPVEVQVKGEYRLIFRLGGDESEDEMIVDIGTDAFELDVMNHIYEFITVSLPFRSIHIKSECNEEMVALLNQYVINDLDEEEDDDADWDDTDDDDFDDDDDDDIEDDEDTDDDAEDNGDDNKNNKDIDPRWSVLKDLN